MPQIRYDCVAFILKSVSVVSSWTYVRGKWRYIIFAASVEEKLIKGSAVFSLLYIKDTAVCGTKVAMFKYCNENRHDVTKRENSYRSRAGSRV